MNYALIVLVMCWCARYTNQTVDIVIGLDFGNLRAALLRIKTRSLLAKLKIGLDEVLESLTFGCGILDLKHCSNIRITRYSCSPGNSIKGVHVVSVYYCDGVVIVPIIPIVVLREISYKKISDKIVSYEQVFGIFSSLHELSDAT